MGEAANKMNDGDYSADKVVELRAQIAAKRRQITEELEELRRRRESAVVQSRKWAAAAGIGALAVLITGSLVNAITDLFRNGEETDEQESRPVGQPATQTNSNSIGRPVIVSMGLTLLKWAAREFIKGKVNEMRARDNRSGLDHSHDDSGYYTGEFPSNATI